MPTVTWGGPVVQFGEYVFTVGFPVGFLTYVPGTDQSLTLEGSTTDGFFIFDASNHQTLAGDANRITGPNTLSFWCWRTPLFSATQTLEFGLVRDPTPADYGEFTLPWQRDEVVLGSVTITDIAEAPGLTNATMVLDTDAELELRAVCGSSHWNGRVAISVRNTSPNSGEHLRLISGATSPILLITTQEDLTFTGLIGGPTDRRQRWVRDSRFGIPTLNTRLVRDGDNPGLWVRPEHADPEDPPARYRPRPGEGSVDDDIGGS